MVNPLDTTVLEAELHLIADHDFVHVGDWGKEERDVTGQIEDAADALKALRERVAELEAGLKLIAEGKPNEIQAVYSALPDADEKILRDYNGYAPNWRATAESRGALVHMQRILAEATLDKEKG